MARFRKKISEVQGYKWTGVTNPGTDPQFIKDGLAKAAGTPGALRVQNLGTPRVSMDVMTPQGNKRTYIGDYVVKKSNGDTYRMRGPVFESNFEEVTNQP